MTIIKGEIIMQHACAHNTEAPQEILKYTVAIHNDDQGLLSHNGQYTSR